MMKRLLLVALCVAAPALASAQAAQTLGTTQRAQLWNFDPNTPSPDPDNLWTFEASPGDGYYPLLQSDFSGVAGQTVLGDGTFNIYLRTSWAGGPSIQPVSLRSINADWNSATVTTNSFFSSNGFGATLDSHDVGYFGTSYWVSFIVPQAVLQGWVNAPATSHGVALENLGGGPAATGHTDLIFGDTPDIRANFQFDTDGVVATPEPASLVLLSTGLIGVVGVAVRRRRVVSRG